MLKFSYTPYEDREKVFENLEIGDVDFSDCVLQFELKLTTAERRALLEQFTSKREFVKWASHVLEETSKQVIKNMSDDFTYQLRIRKIPNPKIVYRCSHCGYEYSEEDLQQFNAGLKSLLHFGCCYEMLETLQLIEKDKS